MPRSTTPIIAIDVDDVLFPNTDRLLHAYNRQFGTNIVEAPVVVGTEVKGTMEILLEQTGLGRDEIIDQVEAVLVSPEFHMAEPLHESVPVLESLAKNFGLVAISARPSVMERQTIHWLTTHYSGLFSSVHILGKRWGAGLTVDKGGVYGSLGVNYVIDDLLRNVIAASGMGLQAILFGEYSWNRTDELPNEITRCRGWREVLEFFDGRD